MLGIVLLFAALLIPGYILGKARAISDASALSFSNILMYVAMPFLVFSKLLEYTLLRAPPIQSVLREEHSPNARSPIAPTPQRTAVFKEVQP